MRKIVFLVLLIGVLVASCENGANVNSTNTRSLKPSTPTIIRESSTLYLAPTALPAITASNAREVLEEFVLENGGCELPCVFGVIPGESGEESVDSLVSYFQEDVLQVGIHGYDEGDRVYASVHREENHGGVTLLFWKNRLRVQFSFNYFFDESEVDQITLGVEAFQHVENVSQRAEMSFEHPYFESLLKSYSLGHILNTYGPPTQILVKVFPDDPEAPQSAIYLFDFVLFYPQQGFVVEYLSVREEYGEYYLGCPTKAHIDLSTWNPRKKLSLGDAIRYFSNVNGISRSNLVSFKPIEDVTSLGISNFYDMYRDKTFEGCVATPKDLWSSEF